MASMKFLSVLLLAFTFSLQGVLADIICEKLPSNTCAFSISSSGKRCMLENLTRGDGKVEYHCKTSEVVAGSSTSEYIETDECVKACGADRKSVGMSSDALLDPIPIARLCSPACYSNCPNLIDLYFNLAAGEGVHLPYLCAKQPIGLSCDTVKLQTDNALVPTSFRRAMVGLHTGIAPAVDVPTQWRYPRRAMTKLLSGGGAAVAPGPISSVVNTPTPHPSYF